MTWILIEGIDRSGKSTVAKYYEQQGYQLVHMSAPDKKYFDPSYTGESYLEELVRLYSKYEGRNVVFDRTAMGELIWPNVFGRVPLLSDEDIEYLKQIEDNNDPYRILMHDPNIEAHWQRCVDSGEPLTRQQFGRAGVFYQRLVNDYGFEFKKLSDYVTLDEQETVTSSSSRKEHNTADSEAEANKQSGHKDELVSSEKDDVETKLEKANAIRSLLKGRIVRKKGEIYDDLEENIRKYLNKELDSIFKAESDDEDSFTNEEIEILKLYAKRIKEKMGESSVSNR